MTKLVDRIKRFFRALNARLEEEDIKIIDEYLDSHHKKVFYSMSIVDQRHSLDVAITLLKSNKNFNKNTIKLALLHDIGKQVQKFYLLERVAVVVFPRKNLKQEAYPYQKSLLKKAWQLKYFHPEYGFNIARDNNFENDLTEMIKYHHHLPPRCMEIEHFQWADNLN